MITLPAMLAPAGNTQIPKAIVVMFAVENATGATSCVGQH
jgi:hypothetical protein